MTKLHEILAVEADARKGAQLVLAESLHNFQQNPHLFKGHVKTTTMLDENEISPAPEIQEVSETVPSKLNYTLQHFENWLNVVYQKEEANQRATADLIVEGDILMRDVPATFLLGLEAKLLSLRSVYESIPTLQQGVQWVVDQDRPDMYCAAHEIETFVTRKTIKSKVLYEATNHHPAQIEKWAEDVRVGRSLKGVSCSMISAGDKARLIQKINVLIAAVKQARQRANEIEIDINRNSDDLINFLLN
ncbi:MAG: hypothetical protein GY941_21020 [Planctomycetes bacterium]|nr:hypothetical protein [Planctomycetota bacterium]